MADDSMKRKTARKLNVSDITEGTYIKRPGWEPSGILTRYGEIARVNLVGIVVSVDPAEGNGTFMVDDGTGSIQVRFFEANPVAEVLKVGDIIRVIGRPREWESSKYLTPEIIKKVSEKAWLTLHKAEARLYNVQEEVDLPVKADTPEEKVDQGPYQKILNIIAMLDTGDGADVQDIVTRIKLTGSESIIRGLIEEGEIFEISPGRVKLLE